MRLRVFARENRRQLALAGPWSPPWTTTANEAARLPPRARVVLHHRVRGSRQLIVAQSADDILDRVIDPGVRDVIAMRHVGRDEDGAAPSEIRLELPAERHVMLGKHVLELVVVAFRQMRVPANEER